MPLNADLCIVNVKEIPKSFEGIFINQVEKCLHSLNSSVL